MRSSLFPCRLAVALVLLSGICSAASRPATEVVRETFDYSGWESGPAPMNRLWYLHSGHPPSPSPQGGLVLGNGAASRALDVPATEDFEITFAALHAAYKRGIWVGLMADSGRGGYGVLWDAGVPDQFSGEGHVSIRRLELLPGSAPAFNQQGVVISDTVVASGHNSDAPADAAIREPFARFRLTWKKSGGMLALYINDALRGTAYDTTFNRFDRLLVQGSNTSRVRELRVRLTTSETLDPAPARQ